MGKADKTEPPKNINGLFFKQRKSKKLHRLSACMEKSITIAATEEVRKRGIYLKIEYHGGSWILVLPGPSLTGRELYIDDTILFEPNEAYYYFDEFIKKM